MRSAERTARILKLRRAGGTITEIAEAIGWGNDVVVRELRVLRAQGVDVPQRIVRGRPNSTAVFAARRRQNLTQRELAHNAGVSLDRAKRADRGQPVAGWAAARIATTLGLQVTDIARIRAAPGLPSTLPKDVLPDSGIDERRGVVARLARAGTSPALIATTLGVGRATVYRDIAALRTDGHDIPARPMGRPSRPPR